MKIGIAVQVLPLCHPLRLAEEAATVDQVSQGRLIFGVGRSGVVSTYDAYQVPYDESRERFTEILDIVKRAWSEPRFSYAGKFHSFDNVACVPQPYQSKLPPIRIAASTPDTFPAIGALGYPVFASTRHADLVRARRRTSRPITTPARPPVIPARARSSCPPRSTSPRPKSGRAPRPRRASPISTGCNTS